MPEHGRRAGGTTLGEVLAERAVRRLVVTGNASDHCVDSTSRSALSHGYDLVLVAAGHTTIERPHGTVPTAARIVAPHNEIFSVIQYAHRSTTATPAAEIRFSA
ncbi:isochorismatase family protein [Streptomyces sp. NPDC051985]|uniref:isochorismatase family protein n=1 Tax=Streptomyces sp. NPDC051985 TaxID=3155807 RepID=UPI003430FB72